MPRPALSIIRISAGIEYLPPMGLYWGMLTEPDFTRKPSWLRVKFPSGGTWKKVDDVLARRGLHTVCDEALCPNKAECWGAGTAAFMILGDVCTRACGFCAVSRAKEGRPVDSDEAARLAGAVRELGLEYAVITSVDRDDLPDRGAGHFAACVRALREAGVGGGFSAGAGAGIEVLIPDYYGAELEAVLAAAPDVIAHNVETVRSLQHVRDGRASFDKSLRTLREAKAAGEGAPRTKSSLLLGLGETREEVLSAMDELRGAGLDILVMGQYLRPTKAQILLAAYITPEQFDDYAEEARRRGFGSVISAPLARTSYHAREALGEGGAGLYTGHIEGLGKPEGCKLIRLDADIEGGIIRAISIRGDFFASPEEGFERAEARLLGVDVRRAGVRFDELLAEEGVAASGIQGRGLQEVLLAALNAAGATLNNLSRGYGGTEEVLDTAGKTRSP